jgi:hypothetical protein
MTTRMSMMRTMPGVMSSELEKKFKSIKSKLRKTMNRRTTAASSSTTIPRTTSITKTLQKPKINLQNFNGTSRITPNPSPKPPQLTITTTHTTSLTSTVIRNPLRNCLHNQTKKDLLKKKTHMQNKDPMGTILTGQKMIRINQK